MLLCFAAVTGAVSLASPTALAGPISVGLAPAQVDPETAAAEEIDAQVEAAFSEGFEILRPKLGTACAAAECAQTMGDELDVKHVVTAAVTREGVDQFVRVTLWRDGESVAAVEDQCEICGEAEVVDIAAAAAQAVARKAERLTRPGTLTVTPTPPNATVMIDGKRVDPGTSIELYPGEYIVEAMAEGYSNYRSVREMVPGVEESFAFELTVLVPEGPAPEPEPEPEPQIDDRPDGRGLRVAGYTGLGLGLAAAGGGIALIAIEERPSATACTDANIDENGTCKFRYATLEPGIALAVAGGAIAIGSIVMIAIGHKRKRDRNVGIYASPRSVVLSGRF